MDNEQSKFGYAAANRRLIAASPSWFIPPPHGWRHPVTGRQGWQPDPLLIAFGQYVKRSRYMASVTQRELARLTGVDQGAISRLERALAPAAKVENLVKLADVLGRDFPLGYCPHEHWCEWQPAPPSAPEDPRAPLTDDERDEINRRWLEQVMRSA
jgi:transcriptional regulator with XRE-family HTH domain